MNSQTYAHRESTEVTKKTIKSSTFLISSLSPPTAMMDTPVMQSKLKAADPTIVDGPNSPGTASISLTVPITDKRISGADEPRAMSVRLATVAFQIGNSTSTLAPLSGSN